MDSDNTQHWARLDSLGVYDFSECGAVVEMALGDPLDDDMRTRFTARINDDDNLFIGLRDADLTARTEVGGANDYLHAENYDAQQHRWLGIRGRGQSVEFYVSPDGMSWSLFAAADKPIAMDSLQIRLEAGTRDNRPLAFSADFDNLNLPP